MAKKYATIISLNDYEDEKVNAFLENKIDESEIIDYLSGWDYGEYHYLNDCISPGSYDYVGQKDPYFLIYNRGLGYVSLEIELDGNEYE